MLDVWPKKKIETKANTWETEKKIDQHIEGNASASVVMKRLKVIT